MCDVTWISLAVSAVSAVGSAVQQTQNNKNQVKAIDEQSRLNLKQADEVRQEVDEVANQEKSARAQEAMKARASLRVAAGEAGVGGTEVSLLDEQVQRDLSRDLGNIESNRARRSRQASLDSASVQAELRSRRDSIPKDAAVWTQAGLQIAGAYADNRARARAQRAKNNTRR